MQNSSTRNTQTAVRLRAQSSSSSSPPYSAVSAGNLEDHRFLFFKDADNSYAIDPRQDVLTSSPCLRSCRPSGPPTLPSAQSHLASHSPNFAIQSHQNNYIENISQDVLLLNDVSGPSYQAAVHQQHPQNVFAHQHTLESHQLPSNKYPAFQNGSINPTITRTRTSHPVFESPSDLAAHHGIPQQLPPIPISISNSRPSQNQLSVADTDDLIFDYVNRVSQPSEAPNSSSISGSAVPSTFMEMNDDTFANAGLAEAMMDPNATPEWTSYLTSPFDESPLDAFLNTPVDGEYLTGPMIDDSGNDMYYQDQLLVSNPLFDTISSLKIQMGATQTQLSSGSLDLDGLITMSPFTPALDADAPTMFPTTSKDSAAKSSNATSRPTKKLATGTRKNIKPESLIPVDAPTQHRSYTTPSATSRKELPAVFAKKRLRSMAYGDEEDELAEEIIDPNIMPPTSTEAEAIAAKRRQNTIAARRSRKRKLEHQKYLEENLEKERQDKEEWKRRAIVYRDQLRGMGVNVPQLPDP